MKKLLLYLFVFLGFTNVAYADAFVYLKSNGFLANSILNNSAALGTSVTKNNIYILTEDKKIKHCDIYGLNCSVIDNFNHASPETLSFNDNGDGVVGVSDHNKGLAIYRQNQFVGYASDQFGKGVRSVSQTNNAIYVINRFNELWKCDTNGVNCREISTYTNETNSTLSFNNDGNGVIGTSTVSDPHPVPDPVPIQ